MDAAICLSSERAGRLRPAFHSIRIWAGGERKEPEEGKAQGKGSEKPPFKKKLSFGFSNLVTLVTYEKIKLPNKLLYFALLRILVTLVTLFDLYA